VLSNIARSINAARPSRFIRHAFCAALSIFLITCTIRGIRGDEDAHRQYSIERLSRIEFDENVARARVVRVTRTEPIRTGCSPTRETFLKCVGDMVREENSIIEAQRIRLFEIEIARSLVGYIDPEDVLWLSDMMRHYNANTEAELTRRMDIIPVDMALAQSLLESGWGTSYAARIGNALFGQIQSRGTHSVTVPWTPGPDRPQPFASYRESVTAYFMNLNTHPAYARFRIARETTKDPILLMNYMERYSIRGIAYIRQIQGIIVSFKKGELK